jgi:retinol dehydrogenase-12
VSTAPVALVTGATDGIGLATARGLARAGFEVVVHGRSPARLEAALASLARDVPGARVSSARADLASTAEIRALARELEGRLPRLDVLVNNAGVFANERQETAEGVELTWMVNHLAPVLLTYELRGLLARSAPARVITVSSVAHTRGGLDPDDLELARGWSGYRAYAASKLGNVLFTFALARRTPPEVFTAHALHPGVITTKLLATGFGGMAGEDVDAGARTTLRVATSPEGGATTGRYWSDERVVSASREARDEGLQERVWARSAARLGIPEVWG